MTKRFRDTGVLRHCGLADRVSYRMAQPLHLRICCIPRLQVGEGCCHALPVDDRAVMLLVAPQCDAGVLATTASRWCFRRPERLSAQQDSVVPRTPASHWGATSSITAR